MNYLEIVLSWLTLGFVTALCGFVLVKKSYRALPFFSVYSFALLASTVGVGLVYKMFGYNSLAAYYAFWSSLLFNAAMRSLAIAELCRYKLRVYRGIWGLVWRLFVGISMIFFLHASFDTWGQPNRLAIYSLTLDRDLDIASVAILASLLLVHRYYGLALERFQKTLAAGICLVCAVDIIGNTVLKNLFTGYLFPFLGVASSTAFWFDLRNKFMHAEDIWSAFHLLCFMAATGIWCYALRRPIPQQAEAPDFLPAEVYRELSPAINLRLSTFNDRLVELLKP